jgi:hypothetical protein
MVDSDDKLMARTRFFRWPIFKQKKGSTTISLGLNYRFMGSSQSPSRDTVPLKKSGTKFTIASIWIRINVVRIRNTEHQYIIKLYDIY